MEFTSLNFFDLKPADFFADLEESIQTGNRKEVNKSQSWPPPVGSFKFCEDEAARGKLARQGFEMPPFFYFAKMDCW